MEKICQSTPIIPLDAGLFINTFNKPLRLRTFFFERFFLRNIGPNISNSVVPKSNPIVKLIVVEVKSNCNCIPRKMHYLLGLLAVRL